MFSCRENISPETVVSAKDMLQVCREYDANQWRDPVELEQARRQKLAALLQWADRHIPFYRARFAEAGLKHGTITGMEAFRRIPLLRREDLAHAEENGLKTGEFSCVATRTTGTSGRKLKVWISPDYGSLSVFPSWRRALKAGGLAPQDRYLRITYLGRGVYPTVGRTLDIELRDSTEDLLAQLRANRPDAILAIPSTLEFLGLDMLGRGIEPPESLRRIFTCGEHLNGAARRLIRRAFQCDPVDHYSATEISSGIAWQCERREGYHINADNLVVEILDDQNEPVPPGREGRLVLTDLSSRPVPIIRYDIGDRASWQAHDCPCGRTLPCLSSISGREIEWIRLSSGERLTVHDIAGAFYAVPEARQFQIREEEGGRIIVDVVMQEEGTGSRPLAELRRALMRTVLATGEWELNPVSRIPGELFAKRKLIVPLSKQRAEGPAGG
jgi:phenylacetate-CoA ligase